MAKRGDVYSIRVGGMDSNSANRLCFFQAHMFLSLSAIYRAIDAVSLHDIATTLGLTHAYVDDIRI